MVLDRTLIGGGGNIPWQVTRDLHAGYGDIEVLKGV